MKNYWLSLSRDICVESSFTIDAESLKVKEYKKYKDINTGEISAFNFQYEWKYPIYFNG